MERKHISSACLASFRPNYVDAVTGESLFAAANKFDSGCGWQAFASPTAETSIIEATDESLTGIP